MTSLEVIIFWGSTALSGSGSLHYRGFTITPGHTTIGRTSLTSAWYRTTLARNSQLCPRWYSNLQSQQASDCKPTP